MGIVLARTVIIYILLTVFLRLMGKRQIGELQLSELIVTFLLSELATIPLVDREAPLLPVLVPIGTLLLLEVILSSLVLRSSRLKSLLMGTPSVIIQKGVLDQKELARQRTGISELLSSLRQNGISDISDVEYAILEPNGTFSFFPRAEKGGVTPEQSHLQVEEPGIAHALILDQKVIEDNLPLAGWTRPRLDRELEKRGLAPEGLFLFAVDDAGSVTAIPKEESR